MKKWILAIILILLILFFLFNFLTLKSRIPTFKPKIRLGHKLVVRVDMKGRFEERSPGKYPRFFVRFRKPKDFESLLETFEYAKNDERIKGISIVLNSPIIGIAKVEELTDRVERFREETGKPVYIYSDYYTLGTLLLASSCERVFIPPTGELIIPGIRVEPIFFKGTMDKLGIQWDIVKMKEYKNGLDPFVSDTLSPESREVYTALVDTLYRQTIREIAEARGIDTSILISCIDSGIITAKDAKNLGLVDSLIYPIDYEEIEQELAGDEENITGFLKYITEREMSFPPREKKIAVIYASGSIHTGESKPGYFGASASIGSKTYTKALKDAADDDDIIGIILRVDSGGGSALASDIIRDAVQYAKDKKPVIASMTSVAASGGYYIAMACDSIFVEPMTITGSIGVLYGKPSLKGLYEKLGIRKDISIYRGKHSGLTSDYERLTPEEYEFIKRYIEDIYNDFVGKAAEDRKKGFDELEPVARGRVYTGKEAITFGLVDRFGGLNDAIDCILKKENISRKDVSIVEYPRGKELFEFMLELGISKVLDIPTPALELYRAAREYELFQDGEALFLTPVNISVK